MTLRDILNKFNFKAKVNIHSPLFDISLEYSDVDKQAAWDLYIELLTRITTQTIEEDSGDEKTALQSVFGIFGYTREVLHKNGPHCATFAKVAILILNKVIRPFTAKYHKISLAGGFSDPGICATFRKELADLQIEMEKFTAILANIAGLPDDMTEAVH